MTFQFSDFASFKLIDPIVSVFSERDAKLLAVDYYHTKDKAPIETAADAYAEAICANEVGHGIQAEFYKGETDRLNKRQAKYDTEWLHLPFARSRYNRSNNKRIRWGEALYVAWRFLLAFLAPIAGGFYLASEIANTNLAVLENPLIGLLSASPIIMGSVAVGAYCTGSNSETSNLKRTTSAFWISLMFFAIWAIAKGIDLGLITTPGQQGSGFTVGEAVATGFWATFKATFIDPFIGPIMIASFMLADAFLGGFLGAACINAWRKNDDLETVDNTQTATITSQETQMGTRLLPNVRSYAQFSEAEAASRAMKRVIREKVIGLVMAQVSLLERQITAQKATAEADVIDSFVAPK